MVPLPSNTARREQNADPLGGGDDTKNRSTEVLLFFGER